MNPLLEEDAQDGRQVGRNVFDQDNTCKNVNNTGWANKILP
jgi:hypothetical protein